MPYVRVREVCMYVAGKIEIFRLFDHRDFENLENVIFMTVKYESAHYFYPNFLYIFRTLSHIQVKLGNRQSRRFLPLPLCRITAVKEECVIELPTKFFE